MTQNVSGYLPNLLGPVSIAADGVAQTARPTINLVGFTGSDNPTYDRLDLTAPSQTAMIIGTGVTSSAASGGTINDVSTANLHQLRYTDAAPPTITGFANGSAGKRITIMSTTGDQTIKHLNVGSAVGNRVSCYAGSDCTVYHGTGKDFEYDAVSGVWRQFA